MSYQATQPVLAPPVTSVKGGQKPQSLYNSAALAASIATPSQTQLVCETDALGLIIDVSVTTVLGTGVFAASASVLSAIASLKITASDKKRDIHFFITPNVDIPRTSFLYDWQAGKGGKYIADTAIASAGTATYTVFLWAKIKASDYPLFVTMQTAALSSLFSTVGTASATLTLVITPIKTPSINAFATQGSFIFSMSGLTASNFDVTPQLPERVNVTQLGLALTTEGDLTDMTLVTPEVEMLSVALRNLKAEDNDTLSGHQTGFLRIPFRGKKVTLTKTGAVLMKLNEGTADNPTVYIAGEI